MAALTADVDLLHYYVHHNVFLRLTTTPGSTTPTLGDQCVGSFTSHRIDTRKDCETGPPVLSSLSEKTRKSNHLQMALQRKHFLLSYLKTLSVGPAGA